MAPSERPSLTPVQGRQGVESAPGRLAAGEKTPDTEPPARGSISLSSLLNSSAEIPSPAAQFFDIGEEKEVVRGEEETAPQNEPTPPLQAKKLRKTPSKENLTDIERNTTQSDRQGGDLPQTQNLSSDMNPSSSNTSDSSISTKQKLNKRNRRRGPRSRLSGTADSQGSGTLLADAPGPSARVSSRKARDRSILPRGTKVLGSNDSNTWTKDVEEPRLRVGVTALPSTHESGSSAGTSAASSGTSTPLSHAPTLPPYATPVSYHSRVTRGLPSDDNIYSAQHPLYRTYLSTTASSSSSSNITPHTDQGSLIESQNSLHSSIDSSVSNTPGVSEDTKPNIQKAPKLGRHSFQPESTYHDTNPGLDSSILSPKPTKPYHSLALHSEDEQPSEVKEETDHGHQLTYKLILDQQPRVGAATGLQRALFDRIPIVPAPVVRVIRQDEFGNQVPIDSSFLVCTCSLKDSEGNDLPQVVHAEEDGFSTTYSRLVGRIVAHAHTVPSLNDPTQYQHLFVFDDLGVRGTGEFTLCFTLSDLDTNYRFVPHSASVTSDTFHMVDRHNFPGRGFSMSDIATPLSRYLIDQGLEVYLPILALEQTASRELTPP